MKPYFISLVAVFHISCGKTDTAKRDDETEIITVVFEIPDDVERIQRILWQRSYPEEYAKLIEGQKLEADNPFGDGDKLPDEALVPKASGWDRTPILRAFDRLGHPMEGNARASWETRLTIRHTPEAIEAFKARFPEFKPIRESLAF